MSIELMFYDRSSYTGVYSSRLSIYKVYNLGFWVAAGPSPGVKGSDRCKEEPLEKLRVGCYGRWHTVQGLRAGRQRNSHSRFLDIE